MEVPCDRAAPRAVRSALDSVEGIDPIRDDAKLIATELVTNAVLQGGAPEDVIGVEVALRDDRLMISVHDRGIASELPRVARDAADVEAGARGMWIVQRIAWRWGSERIDGHRVWAELTIGR